MKQPRSGRLPLDQAAERTTPQETAAFIAQIITGLIEGVKNHELLVRLLDMAREEAHRLSKADLEPD